MTIMFRLEPLIAPQEKLIEGLPRRQPISVVPGDSEVVIGRGSLTGIADHSIGRSVFSLKIEMEMDDNTQEGKQHQIKATLLKDSDKCRVHINGKHWHQGDGATRYLGNGDFLSLDNLRYEYKLFSMNMNNMNMNMNSSSSSSFSQLAAAAATVELLSSSSQASVSSSLDEKEAASGGNNKNPLDLLDGGPCSPSSSSSEPKKALAPAAAAASSPTPITLSKETANRLAEDSQCSICLEIQIQSQTLVPCGHSFCSPCVVGIQPATCPVCRATITQRVMSRQLDGLISNLVAVPGLLDPEDVQQYHVRKQQHALSTACQVMSNKPRATKRRLTSSSPHHHHRAVVPNPYSMSHAPHHPAAFHHHRGHHHVETLVSASASAPAAPPNPFPSFVAAHARARAQQRQEQAILDLSSETLSSSSFRHPGATAIQRTTTDTTRTTTTTAPTGGASVLDAIYID